MTTYVLRGLFYAEENKVLEMFHKCKMVCITLLIVIISNFIVGTYSVTISLNTSTDRSNFDSESDYKYSIYHEAHPVPCDLTTSCDAFCCEDPDCKDNQVSQCSKPSYNCDGLLSFFDCNCDNFDKPEWLSVFCYTFKNPIYLGKFFEAPKKIDKLSTIKSVIQKNSLFLHDQNNGELRARPTNTLGSTIMTFVPGSNSFPSVNPLLRKKPLKDSTYACIQSPVNYRINTNDTCLASITQELCENGDSLGILPYLIQNSNLSANSGIPVVLKNSDFLEGLQTEVGIKCVKLKFKTMKFKSKTMNVFEEKNTEDCPDVLREYHTVFSNNTCQNVLVFVQYQFILNGSDIVKLKAEYGLTNISLPIVKNNSFSDAFIDKYTYLKQRFDVSFFDIMNNNYDSQNSSENDVVYNRGYFIGEELNFGYKLDKNSSTSWEKGVLGVFGKGGSCDSLSPVTFGYNVLSVCYIRQRFPNCTQLRRTVEEKFDAHLQGDNLGIYANLQSPYNDSIPLLRNYRNSSLEDTDNITECEIPVSQAILILYTSMPTDNGIHIHRILGSRVDRVFKDVSTDFDVLLTAKVFFFHVSSSKDKPMSRFWSKMYSRELSDNSWLNIFEAFEDVDRDEKKEITIWCIALILLVAAVIAFTKTFFSVHLGKCISDFNCDIAKVNFQRKT